MTVGALVFTEPRDAHFEREGLWSHDEVTPPREDQARRSTDASRLTFPLQLVIVIVGGIIATTGAFWVATSAIRSDVRDILTRMSMQAEIDKTTGKIQDERAKASSDAMSELKRQQQMQYYDIQDLKRDVAVIKSLGVGVKK